MIVEPGSQEKVILVLDGSDLRRIVSELNDVKIGHVLSRGDARARGDEREVAFCGRQILRLQELIDNLVAQSTD